jgi:hypothetical protein
MLLPYGDLQHMFLANSLQNSFNVSMPKETHDLPALSTCTSCQFTEDFSNYWTAVIFYRAKNGTFKRVPQMAQAGMEGTQGGMVGSK